MVRFGTITSYLYGIQGFKEFNKIVIREAQWKYIEGLSSG